MQFVIDDGKGKASLWCEQHSVLEDGRITFEVINGSWRGIYDPQKHKVYVNGSSTVNDGKIIWQGRAPFSLYHYNEALVWVDEQVALTGGVLRDWIYVDTGEADYTESEDCEIPF